MKEKINSPGSLIALLYRKANMFWTLELKEYGLSAAEYPVMLRLYRSDGITQEEISREVQVDKSAVTRVLQSLMAKGLVERRRDENDRRCNRIFLTDQAEKYRNQIEALRECWGETLQRGMTEEEKQIFMRLLSKAAENAKEWMEACQ